MTKKIWKSFFYSFVFFFSLFFIFVLYFNYQIKDELNNYSITVDEINQLSDIYIICSGLKLQNPSEENKIMCEEVRVSLQKAHILLKEKYPYMNLYEKIVGK